MPENDSIFTPQQELIFAANPVQINSADILIGRIGCNVSAGLTGSGVTGSSSWITSVQTNTPPHSFAGVISEIIVFDRKLDPDQRDIVYGYLARKYGATLSSALPNSMENVRPSAYNAGLTYWNIEHHPNSKDRGDISRGSEFSGIKIDDFSSIAETTYKSEGTRLYDGTVLSGDTYDNIGS